MWVAFLSKINQSPKRKLQIIIGFAIFAFAVAISYFSVVEADVQDTPQYDIFLVIDVSGSMQDDSKLVFAKQAALEFVDIFQLDQSSDHQIGLVAFSDYAQMLVELDDDSQNLKQGINKLYPGGTTAMGEGVLIATQSFSQETRPDTKKILVLDKIEGTSIRNIDQLKKQEINLKKLSRNLIQHFLRQAVRDGFFHADMHQGNLFVNNNGEIIPVDFGIMGRLSKNNKRYLAEILYAFINRDYKKVAKVHFLAGLVPKNTSLEEFSQALRSVGEPIFGQKIENISGSKLLSQLFEITEKFNMQTQTQLLLLQKTMVVVEGVARKIDPEANIWDISKPILENWLNNHKDPINKINDVFSDASEILKRIPELPKIMDKANDAITLMAEGKFNPNSQNYHYLKEEELKLKLMRNKLFIGILIIVIFILIVFK